MRLRGSTGEVAVQVARAWRAACTEVCAVHGCRSCGGHGTPIACV
jgi:hypothetical protein